MKISIPIKLDSLNKKEHWATAYKKTKRRTWAIQQLLKTQNLPPFGPQDRLLITITSIRSRELDYDNLVGACKFLADTVSDCLIPGLAPGQADSDKRLFFHYQQAKCKRGEESVEIEIRPYSAESKEGTMTVPRADISDYN